MVNRTSFVGLLLALGPSCFTGPAQPAREPASVSAKQHSVEADAATVVADASAGTEESKVESTAADAAPSAAKETTQEPEPSNSEETLEGWFAAKGIKDLGSDALIRLAGLPASVNVHCDQIVPVGKPFKKAALCRRQFLAGDWGLETSFLLLVPEQAKLRAIWEARAAAGTLNRTNVSEDPWVQLSIEVQDDGVALFLQEIDGVGCAEARKRAAQERKDAESQDIPVITAVTKAVDRVCQARGKYLWQGSTFGRVSGPTPRGK